MSFNPMTPMEIAAESVSQLFTAAKSQMTPIECSLWMREIERLGPQAMLNFVEFWASGGGQGSFQRAPKIEDFRKLADPQHISAEAALEILRAEVARCGCWGDPNITDARLTNAVLQLGGWAKVNQDMPDPSDAFEYKRYADRFKHAWTYAEAQAVQCMPAPPPLLGLVSQPSQLKLLAAQHSDQAALPAPDSADSVHPQPESHQ